MPYIRAHRAIRSLWAHTRARQEPPLSLPFSIHPLRFSCSFDYLKFLSLYLKCLFLSRYSSRTQGVKKISTIVRDYSVLRRFPRASFLPVLPLPLFSRLGDLLKLRLVLPTDLPTSHYFDICIIDTTNKTAPSVSHRRRQSRVPNILRRDAAPSLRPGGVVPIW